MADRVRQSLLMAVGAGLLWTCSPSSFSQGSETLLPDAGVVDEPGRHGWPPPRPDHVNPIVEENLWEGDDRWDRFDAKATNGELEGYADRTSVRAGETFSLHVSSSLATKARWQLYRLGWYGGAGARRIADGRFNATPQPSCPMKPVTGLIQCAWASVAITVPDDAVSGLHLVKLIRDDGYGSWVPLVVTDDRPADLLFQASVATWQAYNDWGGASLYRDQTGTLPHRKAVEVSFDRPYSQGLGSGQLMKWEVLVARFLERAGYDVSYTTNVDVATHDGEWLAKRGAFLSVGHDEYWALTQRDAVEQALALGMPLLFFSANSAYWQIRLEDDRGAGPRTVVGWKEAWPNDPQQGPTVTARFRDPPVGRPENALLGIMFDKWQSVRAPLVVVDEEHFLFRNTGLREGDLIPGLMGYETDAVTDNGHTPPGLRLAASTGVVGVEGNIGRADTVSYRADSGALVFATGTIEWAFGLGDPDVFDPRVETMTANVLEEALNIRPLVEVGTGPVPSLQLEGPYARHVTTLASDLRSAVAVAPLGDGGFVVADPDTHRLLRVGPPPDAAIVTLVGDGQPGASGWSNEVPLSATRLNQPVAVMALDSDTLVVADTKNHCIRQIRLRAAKIGPLAGDCGRSGYADGVGTKARFAFPSGLARNPATGELVVADAWNDRVRAIDLATKTVRTVAGSAVRGLRDGPGAQAAFSFPTAVAADETGRIYVASSGTFSIARIDIDPQTTVTTLAGGRVGAHDGPATKARLAPQGGLVYDDGALYFTDAGAGRIRRLTLATGRVSTVAGGARLGERDGAGDEARFRLPLGLALDAAGNLLVMDAQAGTVRRVER